VNYARRVVDVTIRPTTEDDWHEVRSLRLEMLRDTPHAFLETEQAALRLEEPEWRLRGARGTSATGVFLAAVDPGGRWVGTMGGTLSASTGDPVLVGVYITPSHRGHAAGVADALLDAIEEWARRHGSVLRLAVHEDNRRAQAFYSRHGFVLTGKDTPYPLNPSERELEMTRLLTEGTCSP
jgi:GNAT superfamily N-acetyltransferase